MILPTLPMMLMPVAGSRLISYGTPPVLLITGALLAIAAGNPSCTPRWRRSGSLGRSVLCLAAAIGTAILLSRCGPRNATERSELPF